MMDVPKERSKAKWRLGAARGMKLLLQAASAALLLAGPTQASPTKTERMVVSQMRLSDLDASASGYAYDQRHDGLPVSYVQYTSHSSGSGLPHPAYDGHYDYPAYDYEQYRQPVAPYYELYYDVAPDHHQLHHDILRHHEDDDDDDSFEGGAGAEKHAEDNSVYEEEGDEGYSKKHEFDRAEAEDREAEHGERSYAGESGVDSGHEDSGLHHEAKEQSESGHEGEKYGNESYKRKGQKTSGFHNVYHKDEYKKDTTFYDEDHVGGAHEKYGAHDAHHNNELAHHQKTAHHDSAHEAGHQAAKGHHDSGKQHSSSSGHELARGEDAHRNQHSGYGNSNAGYYDKHHGFKAHGYR